VRIVSLLPSATEVVCLLGLADRLVGVSADSDWPEEVVKRLPVVNTVAIDADAMTSREIDAAANASHRGASLYHVDHEVLRALHPDLILTQEICDVCAVTRQDVELATRTLGYTPDVVSLNPVNLEQVFEDIETVARRAGFPQRGAEAVRGLRDRVERVRRKAAELPRPRVFCMEWLDPPFTAGHWVPEMVEIAGGRDTLATPAASSERIAWQDVVSYSPEVLVLIPCSLSLDRVASEFRSLADMPGWDDLPAVNARRVYAGHTHLFSQSGMRLIDGLEALARMLHPEVFGEPIPPGQALKITPDGRRLEPYC
jgi:iron complex transport system substrate-binding protein